MTQTARSPASYLVAECGTTTTAVHLFDVVAGEYRLIAQGVVPTTVGAPWNDLMVGVRAAMKDITYVTGRRLVTEQGDLITPTQSNGSGVDGFGAVFSSGNPLRALIAGLLEDVSILSARRALGTIYADIVATFSMADSRSEQEQFDTITGEWPDVILLTGGTNGGDSRRLLRLAETLGLALNLLETPPRPHVIFAGNDRAREDVVDRIGGNVVFHVAENLRPTLQEERLGETTNLLQELYGAVSVAELPGFEELERWSHLHPGAAAPAFARMITYFAALYKGTVIGVDIGSGSVTLALADERHSQHYVASGTGMGRPMARFVEETPAPTILKWQPNRLSADAFYDHVYNRAGHPAAVPGTPRELELDQVLARAVLERAAADAAACWQWQDENNRLPPCKLLVLRGRVLTSAPDPAQALLVALDALQPAGVFSVVLDRYSILAPLGMLAGHAAEATVQVLESGPLQELGWVIAPVVEANDGEHVLTVEISAKDRDPVSLEVSFGNIVHIPLDRSEKADLKLQPARKVDIGLGPGVSRDVSVFGGAVGLVVDARGRPIRLSSDWESRREQLQRWQVAGAA